jgi:predicted  nucleic acid-binding Zn-ribbon protein
MSSDLSIPRPGHHAGSQAARFGAHPSMVLSAYLEPLVRGRRVAVLGDATLGLAERIAERGARLVHAYDPDAARTAEAIARSGAGARVNHAVLEPDLGVRDGAFDVAILPDISLFIDPRDIIRRARRLIGPSGIAVFVTPNGGVARRVIGSEHEAEERTWVRDSEERTWVWGASRAQVTGAPGRDPGAAGRDATGAVGRDASTTVTGRDAVGAVGGRDSEERTLSGDLSERAMGRDAASGRDSSTVLGYYELFDLVSLQFSVVRMVGQAPFIGYAVADFAPDGEPEVTVDTSLLDATEEPEWFLAIASERAVALDPFAVIEIPFASLHGDDFANDDSEPVTAPRGPRMSERIASLTAEVEHLREQQRDASRETEARSAALTAMSSRLVQLESELAAKTTRLKEVEGRLGDDHVRAERLLHDLHDVEEEVARQRERATRLAKQLDDERKARTKADVELGMIRAKPELTGAKDRLDAVTAELEAARAHIEELRGVTAELQAARARISELGGLATELQRAQARIQELSGAAAELEIAQGRIDELSGVAAELEAAQARIDELGAVSEELEAARARIDELDVEVSSAPLPASTLSAPELALNARVAELEAAMRDAQHEVAHLVAERDLVQSRAEGLEEALAEAARARESLAQRSSALDLRCEMLTREVDGVSEAHGAEVARLESALRERGQVVTTLRKELRESDRIGKELITELEAALFEAAPGSPTSAPGAGSSGVPSGGPAGGVDPYAQLAPEAPAEMSLMQRLDTLADTAARREADLHAASWRIAELELRLADAGLAGSSDPLTVHDELEQALVAAHGEVASLRRALAGHDTEPVSIGTELELSRAVIEQAVLLHQVAAERSL